MRGSALLFATARYSDPQLRELDSTRVDVGELRAVLADPAIGGFGVAECIDLPGQTCRERLEEFFADASRDDLLLVYVSGHGIKDRDGRLYFAAADTKLNRLMSTGVAASFIQEASARSRSRRMVMIFDTCFSGAFAKGYQLKAGGTRIDSGQCFSEGGGKIVITASDDMQYAFAGDAVEGKPVPSVFTRHLVEGLRTGLADVDGDGAVTVDDLYRYVYDAVRRENPSQRPQQWAFGLSGDIVLATNPKPRPGKLPVQLTELLMHPNPAVRRTGIDELARLARGQNGPLAVAARLQLKVLCDDDSRSVSLAARTALGLAPAPQISPDAAGRPTPKAQPAKPPPPDSPSRPSRWVRLLRGAGLIVGVACAAYGVFLASAGVHPVHFLPLLLAGAGSAIALATPPSTSMSMLGWLSAGMLGYALLQRFGFSGSEADIVLRLAPLAVIAAALLASSWLRRRS